MTPCGFVLVAFSACICWHSSHTSLRFLEIVSMVVYVKATMAAGTTVPCGWSRRSAIPRSASANSSSFPTHTSGCGSPRESGFTIS